MNPFQEVEEKEEAFHHRLREVIRDLIQDNPAKLDDWVSVLYNVEEGESCSVSMEEMLDAVGNQALSAINELYPPIWSDWVENLNEEWEEIEEERAEIVRREFGDAIKRMAKEGLRAPEIARKLGVGAANVYNALRS